MKDWHYAVNNHPDWRLGSLHVYEYPFWLWLCERVVDSLSGMPFSILSKIPLPNIGKIHDDWSKDTYTWREWYGTLGGVWWIHVFDPCFQWVWYRKQKYEVVVELGYDKIKELFESKDSDFFKRVEND